MKCKSSKQQFKSRDDAIKHNKGVGKEKGTYASIYQCDICNDWHLTTRTQNGIIKKRLFYKREKLNKLIDKMRNLIIISALFLLSSCDTFFSSLTFKVIGSGTFNVGLSENGTYSSSTMSAKEFKVNDSGVVILSAQSNSGTGVRVEAYIGKELIKSASASGYGVASITIQN